MATFELIINGKKVENFELHSETMAEHVKLLLEAPTTIGKLEITVVGNNPHVQSFVNTEYSHQMEVK